MQKVLVITYYWPPAGGPGVQRWLKFVKYLPEFGIEPIVFIPKNPHYPLKDQNLVMEVSDAIRVIRYPIFEPYALASFLSRKKTNRISSGLIQNNKNQSFLERFLLWIRGNLFIPDARKFWVSPSIRFLKKIIEEENIQNIITTGPPHSVHLIGLGLQKKLDIKWIADFRDPWTSIGYHKKLKLTKNAEQKHKRLEQKVLQSANVIVVTSQTTKQEFGRLTRRPISVITNGFDFDARPLPSPEKFTISHIGSLLTERDPHMLWAALRELIDERTEFKENFCLNLVGIVGQDVLKSIEDYGLGAYAEFKGYVPHDEVVIHQTGAQVLLLVEIDSEDTTGIIPGKLFEYFRVGRPILAIGPNKWEAGIMVKNHKAGAFFTHQDKNGIKKQLLHWFIQYQSGNLSSNSENIEKYHRRELTKQLAQLI